MRALTLAVAVGTLLSVACTESTPTALEPPSTAAENVTPSQGHGKHRAQFVQISAGEFHTCAVRVNGAFYCWGSDESGQIGIAPTATCDLLFGGTGVACVPEPTRITVGSGGHPPTSLRTASLVSAGGSHTCALSFGRVWCWGSNSVGQVGVSGGGASVATPTPVSTMHRFLALDAGGNATCAVSLASSLFCWGERRSSTSFGTTPTLYAHIPGHGLRVDVDYTNGCVQSLMNGWQCFGDNRYGALATDPTLLPQSVPLISTALTANARRIVTSNLFMCAELKDGTISCVGNDHDMQLGGNPTSDPHWSYIPVIVGNGMKLHALTVGGNHACALDNNSKAWCWGENTNGELGNNNGGNTDVPQAVYGGIEFRALAAGGSHTCGIALDDTIYCWGANRHGEAGDPAFVQTRVYSPHPTAAPKG